LEKKLLSEIMSVGKLLQDTLNRFIPSRVSKRTLASTTTALFSFRSISTCFTQSTAMSSPSSVSASASSSPSVSPPIKRTISSTTTSSGTHQFSQQTNTLQASQQRRGLSSSAASKTQHENHHSVIILGSGPAGLTAALYTARANLSPLVLEGNEAGGQLTTTTDVENFPGFPDGILGYDLIMDMKKQAEKFGTVFKAEHVESVDFSTRPFRLNTHKSVYYADSVIIASGASAKYLGLPNEQRLIGHGVSACATCDGWFFKQKPIAVIGGGDSAMEEACFLTKFASKVYLIHRRDEFRASKIMQERTLANDKIEILWNTVCLDVLGKDKMEGLRLKDLKNDKEYDLNVSGLFLAIGHDPNTQCFKNSGLELDEHGYVTVKPGTVSTNIDGVFACGDVQDTRYKQAITAAGTGCMAAMDAEKFLEAQHQSKL